MPQSLSKTTLKMAATIMHRGGVIAYPTEAVWGLGCDPSNDHAIARLLSLKNRDPDKGLILVAATIEQLQPYLANLSDEHKQRLQDSWPGPNTWLVPINRSRQNIPYGITGKFSSIALRVSDHPTVKALCHEFGGPIVSTSANPQGKQAARFSWQVQRYFRCNHKLNGITQGYVGKRKQPSQIKDLCSNRIIR